MDVYLEAGGLGVCMIDGSGVFLLELKWGFLFLWVVFCKMVGLFRFFFKFCFFNCYYLGYLDEMEINEVEVLVGVFMFMRCFVLDEVGLLDEVFFMYGEDIDLFYCIIQGGYKNYYLFEILIIYYKGESIKKGSLNYVCVFYNVMIIFVCKYFIGNKVVLFVLMLQIVIYLWAGLIVVLNFLSWVYLLLFDGLVIYIGLFFLKDFWGVYYFQDLDYYSFFILYVNFLFYVGIWLFFIFFNGGYDECYCFCWLVRGVMLGILVLFVVYGLLE